MKGEERRSVGAHGEEGHEPKVEEAGVAPLQIKAKAKQRVNPAEHQNCHEVIGHRLFSEEPAWPDQQHE